MKLGKGLFTRLESDRKRGDGFKLKEGKGRVTIGQKSFSVRVMRQRKRFTCEAPGWMVLSPSWPSGRAPCHWQGDVDDP